MMSQSQLSVIELESQPEADRFYQGWGFTVDRSRDCPQFDVVLIAPDGREIRIEEKHRSSSFHDIAVEMMDGLGSVSNSRGKCRHDGWILYTDCDWLVYTKSSDGEMHTIHTLKMPDFRAWFLAWLGDSKWGQWITSTKGTRGIALNVVVPLDVIPAELIATYERSFDGEWPSLRP
jgi:hypothetical protein